MTSTISGRVLNVLQELSLTQRQLAERIELDEVKLSKSLNGIRNFTSLELARIAELSGRTVEWLIAGREPREVTFAARASHPNHSDFLEPGKAIAEKYLNAHDALVNLNRGRLVPAIPQLKESGSFVRDGAAMAVWASDQLPSESVTGATLNFSAALETAFGLNIASSDDLPEHCDGLSYEDPEANFRLILVATTSNWTRRRFTIAHELGHILWGDARCNWISEELATRTDDYKEKRANSFAANFLMPESLVRSYLEGRVLDEQTFHALAMHFKVSPSALVARLFKLQLIDSGQVPVFRSYRSLDSAQAADAMAELLSEQSFARAPTPPLFMLSQFVRAYVEGETTTQHLVNLSNLDAEQWRRLLNSSPVAVPDTNAPADGFAEDRELAFTP